MENFNVLFSSTGALGTGQRVMLGTVRQRSDLVDTITCYIPVAYNGFSGLTQQQIVAAFKGQLWVKRPNSEADDDDVISYPLDPTGTDGILDLVTSGTYANCYKVILTLDSRAVAYTGNIEMTFRLVKTISGDDPETVDTETSYTEDDDFELVKLFVARASYRNPELTDDEEATVALIYAYVQANIGAKANANILGNYTSIAALATALKASTAPSDGLFLRGKLTDSTLGVTDSPYLASWDTTNSKGYVFVAHHVYTVDSAGTATDYTNTFLYVSHKGIANGVASLDEFGLVPVAQLPDNSIVDSITVVGEPSGTDDTALLQNALNSKGHIKIKHAGTYIVGMLTIYSDTFLEIGSGVIIKKKDETNSYLLINSAVSDGVRNRNIKITGGSFDMNAANNTDCSYDSSTDPLHWSGIGILFYKVDGLSISNVVEIGNENKYCYLIADCTNVYCGNINFDNPSDGLHFQPPLYNVLVENITGYTDDDMISFTMGDYTRFAIGKTGDIENVLVRNIVASANTAEHIKLVGDGVNHTSVFRNMRFENIRGSATVASVCILENDIVDANGYLNNTNLENIVFSGINPTLTGSIPCFLISATSGDITIENCVWNQSGTSRFIRVAGGSGALQKLTVRNIKSITSVAYAMSSFIYAVNTMTIKELNIEDCYLDFTLATAGYFIYFTNNSIQNIHVSNCYFTGDNNQIRFINIDGTSGSRSYARIANSYIKAQIPFLTSTPLTVSIVNSQIVTSINLVYLTDGADIKVLSNNSVYSTAVVSNTTTGVRKWGLSGIDVGYSGLLSALTATEGDLVRSTNVSETSGKGIYYYDGSAWAKIT